MKQRTQFLKHRSTALLAGLLLCVIAVASGTVSGIGQSAITSSSGISIDVATLSGNFQHPLDSAIDSAAINIYFTATGPNGPGVFHVPAAGGTATEVSAGHSFVAPNGIAVSSDDRHVYVADPQAWEGGAIFVVAINGGSPRVLHGTDGTVPLGLDVVIENGQEMIYFTGRDPDDGQVGVFKISATGAPHPTLVAKGAPFVAPDGVTVSRSGAVYVTDREANSPCSGSVFKITGKKIRKIVDDVRLGNPAGLALTLDESTLLLSAIQENSNRDQVLVVDLATLQTSSITQVVGRNHNDAGGLHRARYSDVYSWCGTSASKTGTVYKVAL